MERARAAERGGEMWSGVSLCSGAALASCQDISGGRSKGAIGKSVQTNTPMVTDLVAPNQWIFEAKIEEIILISDRGGRVSAKLD